MYAANSQHTPYAQTHEYSNTVHDGARYGGSNSNYAPSSYAPSNADYRTGNGYGGGYAQSGYGASEAGTANRYRDPSYESYPQKSTTPTSLLAKSPSHTTTGPSYNPVIDPETASYHSKEGKTRYCCGCFASRRACCGTWFCCVFLVLVAIGLAVFFCYPRIPNPTTGDPYVPSGGLTTALEQEFKNSGVAPNAQYQAGFKSRGDLAARSFALSYGLGINVTVPSDNYIDFQLSDIKAVGNLLNTNNQAIQTTKVNATIGRGPITIKKKSTTVFPVAILVMYDMDGGITDQDSQIISLISSVCGSGGGNFQVQVELKLDLHILRDWQITLPKQTVSFACPQELKTLVGTLGAAGLVG
ncbi:hypothetical protein HDV00_000004 [Rhizophlyctis rosea]|nr:hypothetical protein HDV00_000004 [Rhizophlyctis rosea]